LQNTKQTPTPGHLYLRTILDYGQQNSYYLTTYQFYAFMKKTYLTFTA